MLRQIAMARWSKENPAPYMPNAVGNNGAARVKLQRKYFDALLADFAEHGGAAIRIMRIEEPGAYVRVIASLMPKEFTVTDNALGDLSEEDVRQLLIRGQAMLKIIDVTPEKVALPAPKGKR
jgi:hypothetical protein